MSNLIRYFLKKSFIVYGAVGGFVTLVQISLLFFMRNILEVQDFLSVSVAYFVALVLHYFMNKHITFLIKEKKVLNYMSFKYVIVVIISYCIYVFNIYLFHDVIGIVFWLALVLTLGINFILNYILYEKIVFRNKPLEG
ncbi:GtrA family protein [Paenibacillus sp. H1-7]|uniref:GtrA family protein n=1 Tax=Paenibacillus sp. H1-7 TaxID=2282849 RepID=UPI001EF7BA03|nr:GtrA family protein [Paenibacillus sp. H1-7]ULL19027.1 GtrA family protein [Paenibacillus sp. H1-7]